MSDKPGSDDPLLRQLQHQMKKCQIMHYKMFLYSQNRQAHELVLVQNQPNQLDSTLICTNQIQLSFVQMSYKKIDSTLQFVGRSTLLSIVMMQSPELIFDKIGQGLNESLSHDTAPICQDMILLRVLSIRRQMHTNCGEWVSQYCLPHLIHQQIFYD